MADALLSSLASVNSAFHWAAYFAYSSAIMLWIHSCLCHFICSSIDGSPSLALLLLFLCSTRHGIQTIWITNLRNLFILTSPFYFVYWRCCCSFVLHDRATLSSPFLQVVHGIYARLIMHVIQEIKHQTLDLFHHQWYSKMARIHLLWRHEWAER